MSGTSMATPHVSGAAALVLAKSPSLSNLDLKNRLLQTVQVLPGLSGKVTSGGRLNVQKALGAPSPAVPVLNLVKTGLTAEADQNGWADPGETVELTLTLTNLRFATATGVSATLSANYAPSGGPGGESTAVETLIAGDIGPDGTLDLVFSFAIDSGAGPTMNFTLDTSLNGVPHRSFPFTLPIGPRDVILLSASVAQESFYTGALDAGGYSYETLRTSSAPLTAGELSRFKAVVWFGDSYPLSGVLTDYLDGRGRYPNPPRLFVTGQNIGYYLTGSTFYENYFHARYLRNDTEIFDLVGVDDPLAELAISIPLESGDGAKNQVAQDEIEAIAPATPVLEYSGGGQAGLKYDAGALRMIYFAFGFEAIDSTNPATATRADVLGRVLDWLLEYPPDGDFAPVAVPRAPATVAAVSPDTSANVRLDGSRSYDFGGAIAGYEWSEGATLLGTGPVITVPLSFGVHRLTLTVTDNTGHTGSSSVGVSVLQRLFVDNMETVGTEPWTTKGNTKDGANKNSPPTPGSSNLWHKTTRRGSDPGHSPVRSWYYGIDSQGNYDTGYRNWGRLMSPAIALPTSQEASRVVLNALQLVNVEGSNESAIIQISTDNGASWTNLFSRATQDSSFLGLSLDLSAYRGQTVRIGFFIDTRDRVGNNFEGWYVDDVTLIAVP